MGYLFQSFRKIWKNITKPTKERVKFKVYKR